MSSIPAQDSRPTPGPWLLEEHGRDPEGAVTVYGRFTIPDGRGKGELIMPAVAKCAITTRWAPDEEDWANARLIASAPDLLEALERVLGELLSTGRTSRLIEEAIGQARDAIEKARA